MCGIAGLYLFQRQLPHAEAQVRLVQQMTDRIVHRGPDAAGVWADDRGRCTLGHRRLSIIDVSDAGRQPMQWNDGEWTISFNGEIYNFQELKRELQSQGVVFHGRTDTEVLLAGLAVWGDDVFGRLDGMFAFAAFHRPSGELVLARDPFGEKPLYYFQTPEGGLAFASELQCLEGVPGFSPEVCPDALGEVLMFQYIGAPRTIYRHVRKLAPGHVLRLKGSQATLRRYFHFQPGAQGFTGESREALADQLEDILVRSLKRRMIADVPLGAFLSGGVDSSTVCALARRKLGVPLQTFSMGFEGAAESEHELARAFARHLGTEHRDQIVTPSATDFLDHAGQLLDEPNSDSSCLPTNLLARFARQHVTVALSGDGGDELFGGYGRYFATLDDAARNAGTRWSAGNTYYSTRILVFPPDDLGRLLGSVPQGLAEHREALARGIDADARPLLCALRQTDVDNYMPGAVLPKVDRMSMQHSLEVRTPFLNVELARFAEKLPPQYLVSEGRGKLLLKDIAYRYLPREMIDLPKKGFGLPLSAPWGKAEMVEALKKSLGADSKLGTWMGKDNAQQFIARQGSEHGFSIYQAWSVVMLSRWLDSRPAELPAREPVQARVSVQGVSVQSPQERRQVRYFQWLSPSTLLISQPVQEADRISDIHEVLDFDAGISINRIWSLVEQGCLDGEVGFRATIGCFAVSSGCPPDLAILRGFREAGLKISGKTVILADTKDFLLTPFFIRGLRARKAAGLVARNIHDANPGLRHYKFQYFSVARSFWNWVKLRSYTEFRWRYSDGRQVSSSHRYEVSLPPSLAISAGHYSAMEYLVFEGPRQLPPVISSHREIEIAGGGRYSIWNNDVSFTPLLRSRLRFLLNAWSYRLIRNGPHTEKYLPTLVRVIPGDTGKHAFEQALNHLVAVSSASQNTLAQQTISRIVLYTHGLTAGGAERQWCNLAAGLRGVGIEVVMVVQSLQGGAGHYLPLLQLAGIKVIETDAMPPKDAWQIIQPVCRETAGLLDPTVSPIASNALRLAAVLKQVQPDAVLAQLDATNIAGGVAALLANVPKVLLSFRNHNPSNFPYLNVPWLLPSYQALARSSRVVFTGNSTAGNLDYAKWIGIEPDRVKLLRNSIEEEDFVLPEPGAVEQLRRELRTEPGELIVLGVFRLSEEKDPLTFVEVSRQVLEAVPHARVILLGEGAMQAEVEAAVAQTGLQERIHLMGRRRDVPCFLAVASLMLHTSRFEGTPNVVMEAQIAGLPVVGTRAGALPDLVEDSVTGFLADAGDHQRLAACCIRLLTDTALRESFSKSTRNARQRFGRKDSANLALSLLRS